MAPASVQYQLFRNDEFGDCTCANLANLLVQQAAIEGEPLAFTDDEVTAFYFGLGSGLDDGLIETDVLAYVEEHGFALDGKVKVPAVVAIDPSNIDAVKSLCAVFGGLYVGAQLPLRAQNELQAGQPWAIGDVPSPDDVAGTWGGHAMALAGFDPPGVTFSTWGARQLATWEWWLKYVDEAYVVVDSKRFVSDAERERLAIVLAAAASEDAAP